MNRIARAAILLSLGAMSARLLATGTFGWFVQQRMRLPLLAAAVVLIVFGLYEGASGLREEGRDPSSAFRTTGPLVGWLLVLPLVVLISVAPAGLGAAAADRVDAYTPSGSSRAFPAIDASREPVEMGVMDFLDRAISDTGRSLEGVTVRLEGLVVNDPTLPDGFMLTRFLVSCCAADGIPLQVAVRGTGQALEDDTWVAVDLRWRVPETPYRELDGDWVVEADAERVTVVPDPPNDAYESPY